MKNKIAAGILALLVGGFGVHRFYLNQVGLGIVYLLFCWTAIPFIIAFIDGIVLLTMNEREFDAKYNNDDRYRRPDYNHSQPKYKRPDYEPRRPKQQKRPMERPQNNPSYNNNRRPRPPKSNKFRNEGTKRYKDYDFKGAIENYQQSLKVQPKDPQIHFNLACLYSLMEDTQHAYIHLAKAVEQGYPNFEKIREHDHLAYLRTQPDFESFVKNGYRYVPQLAEREKDVLNLTDDVIERLERLAELKNRGVLTEEEFQTQKALILKR